METKTVMRGAATAGRGRRRAIEAEVGLAGALQGDRGEKKMGGARGNKMMDESEETAGGGGT